MPLHLDELPALEDLDHAQEDPGHRVADEGRRRKRHRSREHDPQQTYQLPTQIG